MAGEEVGDRRGARVLRLYPNDEGSHAAAEQEGDLGGDYLPEVLPPRGHRREQFGRSDRRAAGQVVVSRRYFVAE
jgi:hypothetical protein